METTKNAKWRARPGGDKSGMAEAAGAWAMSGDVAVTIGSAKRKKARRRALVRSSRALQVPCGRLRIESRNSLCPMSDLQALLAHEQTYLLNVLLTLGREYQDARAAQLFRAKPGLRAISDDLLHHLAANMRRTFDASRAWGAERTTIVDIVFGEDIRKRKAILLPTDQNTMINDIVEKKADEKGAKTAAATPVNSLRTLYQRYDSTFENALEIMQCYAWIDTPDIFDMGVITAAYQYVTMVLQAQGVPPAIKVSFNRYLGRPMDQEPALEDVMLYHYHRMRINLDMFIARRKEDSPFSIALKREAPAAAQDEANALIMTCAQHVQGIQQLKASGGQLSPEQRAYYAKALNAPADRITAEHAAAHEQAQLNEKRKALTEKLSTMSAGGPPMDMKLMQIAESQKRLEFVAQTMRQSGMNPDKEPPKAVQK